jgi:nucleoside phosphorylase
MDMSSPEDGGAQNCVALVSAIKEEIAPLVRNWKAGEISHDGRTFLFFESGNGNYKAVAICSGIGAEHGRRAAEAVIQKVRPGRIVSVGYAGALDASLKVGDVVEPRIVVSGADGSQADAGRGSGIVVSSTAVADREQKRKLAAAYGAIAVDMEGASVALGARAHGIEFAALKSISDELDFAMPPVNEFVSPLGGFQHAAFAVHVALRPWLWGKTITLARNSARASKTLCAAIERYLNENFETK